MNPRAGRVQVPAVRRLVLPGGLTVLHVEDHRLPTVAASLQVHGGGSIDPAGRAGLASLTASLMGKGTQRRDADALAERIDDLGLQWSCHAGWDRFSLTLAGLAEDLDSLLGLLAEVATQPTFPANEFEIMRRRRLSGLARSNDSPSTLADWAFAMNLFGDHPYGHPLAGTTHSIERATVEGMRALHAAAFLPGASTLVVAGAVPPGRLDEMVNSTFGDWRGETPAARRQPGATDASTPRVVLVDRPDLTQAQIRWGHGGLHRADPDHDACDVMNWILGGGGFSSRMIQRIRAEKGLTYGVNSSFDARRLAGAFRVSTFTPNESVGEVVREIGALVETYRQEGPTENEVSAARDRFVGGYTLQFETPLQVAGHFLELEIYDLPADGPQTYQDRIAALDREMLTALARRTLAPERALIVVVGKADAYADSLHDLGATERLHYRDVLNEPAAS